MSKHSPLPWTIHPMPDDGTCYVRDANNSDVFLGDAPDFEDDVANCELAVKCVNAYPRLIDALTGVINMREGHRDVIWKLLEDLGVTR